MPDVSIVTPTGDRQGSFALLERWIARQTFAGSVEWIVVDDGNQPTPCTMGQVHVRRQRGPGEPRHTLPLNLAEAVRLVTSPLVVVAEDDEWWGPEYLARMIERLKEAELVGESHALNWCLGRRAWTERNDSSHASLCRTAWRSSLNPFVLEVCSRMQTQIDTILWKEGFYPKQLFHSPDPQEVSIKNVPGRKRTLRFHPQAQDPDGIKLAEWIGPDDAATYLGLGTSHAARIESMRSPTLPVPADVLDGRQHDGAVNIVGYFRTCAGLSEHARRIGALLDEAGVPVFYLNAAHHHHYNADAVEPVSTSDLPGTTTIWCINASELARQEWQPIKGRHIGVWMWELEFNPPPHLAEAASHVDEVWAFSRFLERAFKDCGKPVHHVPPFVIAPPHIPFAKDPRFTVFFNFDVASSWRRKNPHGVIKAFKEAFRSDEPVRLVVKMMRAGTDRRLLQELVAEAAGWPVQFLQGHLPPIEQWKLIAGADCYLSLHRSEGIGLGMAEAAWCGIPIIATGYGGNCDWLDESCSIVVPFGMVPSDGHGPYPIGALWAEPDQSFAATQLRRLCNDAHLRKLLSVNVKARAAEELSGSVTTDVMLERLFG